MVSPVVHAVSSSCEGKWKLQTETEIDMWLPDQPEVVISVVR